MAQPKRRVKLLALLLSPLVFFGLVELCLRIAGYRFDPSEAYAGGESFDELTETRIYSPHPRFLWTLHPSTRIDVPERGFVDILTNSLGLRGKEPPLEKEPGELRVLCLGDSVTFGLGLRDGEPWPDRLAKALRRSLAPSGKRVRVVNGAVPGWSSVQGMRLLDEMSWLEPDFVVFWFGLNDVKEARGAPDSAMTAPGGAEEAVRFLRALRVVQLIQAGLVSTRRTLS
ncbi:MAG: SGNH/GDSL hydrolase family protein, partial [Planctomycetota bacterium]